MEEIRIWGTLVNAFAVMAGSLIGLVLKRLIGGKQEKAGFAAVSDHVFKGLGLCVLAIGITGCIKAAVNDSIRAALEGSYAGDPQNLIQLVGELPGERSLIIILSVVLGVLIGCALRLDQGLNVLGDKIQALAKNRFGNVAEGFVSASLLFCVGSMTVVGALNSGLVGDHTMLYTKSFLDFVSSIVLASTMGLGVGLSAAFVLVFQGSITLLAQWIAPFLTAEVIGCMGGVGSVLIIGLALNVLGLSKIKIMNYLPAVFLPAFLVPLANWIATLW